MSARPYHKRYHSDALAGFMALDLEERGAYQTLLDLMYDRQGPVIDNERLLAGYMGVSIRKWRALRESLLAKGKITAPSDGLLSNSRVEKELENDAKTSRKHAENGSKGGRNKAENAKKDNENNEGELAGLEQDASHIRDHIPELDKEEEDGGEKKSPAYAFLGTTIRLKSHHLQQWRSAYHAISDLDAELITLDAWWDSQSDERRKTWFHPTAGMLNRKHQEILARQSALETAEVWDGMP